MSGRTWVTADLHFGHPNIVKFTRQDGSKLRPWDDHEQHDQDIIRFWNELVAEGDRVYLLGDVCIRRQDLWKLGQLKGRKVLIKGNHDIFKLKEYLPYFDDIRACVVGKMKDEAKRYVLTHVPVHPDSLIRFGVNIHGHLHSGNVMKKGPMYDHSDFLLNKKTDLTPDNRYICVSLEHTNFRPVQLSDYI